MDRWGSLPVVLGGGIDLSTESLTLGTMGTGFAVELLNYESSLEGGYEKIKGYSKYDSNIVPGVASSPILGAFVALDGVFGARKNAGSTGVDIYYSTGSGWGSAINSTGVLDVTTTKVRAATYSFTEEVIVFLTGKDPALRYDGSSDVLVNGAGAPTAPKYGVGFKNRLVLGPASNDSSIALSSPYDDTDFTPSNGAIEINVGDKLKGLATFRDTLYIFCENSIHKLVGNTSADFQVVPVTKQIGCQSHDTIQEIGGDLLFLGPDGFRSIAATERIGDISISLMSRLIQPFVRDNILSLSEDKYVSFPIRKKSQYRCLVNTAATASTDTVGVIGKLEVTDTVNYAWSTTQGIHAYSGHSAYINDDELIIIGSPSTGYIYRMESGSDFDGANIPYAYESPAFTFEDATLRKVLYKLDMYTQITGNVDLSLNIVYNYNNTDTHQPPVITLAGAGNFSTYGSAVYDTSVYSGVAKPVLKCNLVGSGFVASVRVSGNDRSPSHRLDSYIIQFAKHGRR
jgi:hypothetical protein